MDGSKFGECLGCKVYMYPRSNHYQYLLDSPTYITFAFYTYQVIDIFTLKDPDVI